MKINIYKYFRAYGHFGKGAYAFRVPFTQCSIVFHLSDSASLVREAMNHPEKK